MAWIKLRRFSWITKPRTDGFPVVDTIKSVASPTQLPVDMSDLILTNALATTVSRPILYDATLHELRLLGSYLSQAPYEHLGLRESFREPGAAPGPRACPHPRNPPHRTTSKP